MERNPIPEFADIMEQEDDRPGQPYFDKTLNYLAVQKERAEKEVRKLQVKIGKAQEQLRLKEEEVDTAYKLLAE